MSCSPTIEIVIPVYNEQHSISTCIAELYRRLDLRNAPTVTVSIVDNASTDDTFDASARLVDRYPRLSVMHLDKKGRGHALRTAWLRSPADVLTYMDVDLSTDLSAFPRLIKPLLDGTADIAIGDRLGPDSMTKRSIKRELISRGYNRVLHSLLFVGFNDAQCGFKAITASAANQLLPYVEDDQWFFDTELLVMAEHAGFRVVDVPVEWLEDPDSRVDIVRTAMQDLSGIRRLRRSLRTFEANRNQELPLHQNAPLALRPFEGGYGSSLTVH